MTQNNVKLQAGLPAIGTQVDGRYELLGLLGRGGFGAVYLARQISMDRDVALKILLTQAVNMEEMVQRFKREVMAIRNLSHPNTIQIYDFSTSDAGFLYYAMEAVKGPTLKHIIREGPIAPIRVRHICRQILKSLSEAHASRIVHRDLKPANIMLAEMHGEVDFVKVLDFGIAKLLDADDGEDELTNAGVLIGTISYMSPEQIGSKQISATTDIYALGLIGVEMLSGQSVFAKSGKWEILNKQISNEPIDIPDFVKNDPVGQIFVKAVSKNPEERFQSALEMIEAFDMLGQCSAAPLVEKGWGKSDPSVLKTTISQSGPISVSSQISTNTPSQPIPISIENLEEIPTIASSNLVLESNSQIIPNNQNASFSSDTNSAFHSDIQFKKSSKLPIIIGILGVAVLAALGVFFLLPGAPEEIKTEPIVKVEPIKEVVVEKEVEKEVKPVAKQIELSGPENATVFDEDDVLLGDLPLSVSVSGPTAFQIKAKGFLQKSIVLSPSSQTEITVRMEAEKQEVVEVKKISKKVDTEKKGVKKRNDSKKKTDVKKNKDEWVPVKKKEKVNVWQ